MWLLVNADQRCSKKFKCFTSQIKALEYRRKMESYLTNEFLGKNPIVNRQFVVLKMGDALKNLLKRLPYSVDTENLEYIIHYAHFISVSDESLLNRRRGSINQLSRRKIPSKQNISIIFDISTLNQFMTSTKDDITWRDNDDTTAFIVFNDNCFFVDCERLKEFLCEFCSYPAAAPGFNLAPTYHQIETIWRYCAFDRALDQVHEIVEISDVDPPIDDSIVIRPEPKADHEDESEPENEKEDQRKQDQDDTNEDQLEKEKSDEEVEHDREESDQGNKQNGDREGTQPDAENLEEKERVKADQEKSTDSHSKDSDNDDSETDQGPSKKRKKATGTANRM
jgi:hypothetical protein